MTFRDVGYLGQMQKIISTCEAGQQRDLRRLGSIRWCWCSITSPAASPIRCRFRLPIASRPMLC
jgi:hypothetical protein